MDTKIGLTDASKYKDCEMVQQLIHKYGLEDFKKLLVAAVENAATETEDLEVKSISEGYYNFLYQLDNLDE